MGAERSWNALQRCPILICGLSLFSLAIARADTQVWPNVPTKTFVMHSKNQEGIGEIRLYDGSAAGTRVAASFIPWLDRVEVVLVKGKCNHPPFSSLEKLKIEPIPTGVDLNLRPIVLPSPLQEVWDYYSELGLTSLVDHGLSIVAWDVSTHDTQWCGDLAHDNEGDPLPAAGY